MVLYGLKPAHIDERETNLYWPILFWYPLERGSAVVNPGDLSRRDTVKAPHIVRSCVADADDPVAKAGCKSVFKLHGELMRRGNQAVTRRNNTGNARHSGSHGRINRWRRVMQMDNIESRLFKDLEEIAN